jgi:hypothetical protein
VPIAYSMYRTPEGREVLGMNGTGTVTGAEAEEFRRLTFTGGVHFGKALLIFVDRSVVVTTEARKVFTLPPEPGAPRLPTAIITPTTTLRVLLNFMTRVSGSESNSKFFSTERDAAAWLDQQLAAGPSSPGVQP